MGFPKGMQHPSKRGVVRECEKCGAEFETLQWKINQGKGKYCSKECYRLGSRKVEGVEFDGKWFGKHPPNPYYWHKTSSKTSVSLHKYVWEKHNECKVPEGYLVHHKDHNTENNDPSNLVLETVSNHARYHLLDRYKDPSNPIHQQAAENRKKRWKT